MKFKSTMKKVQVFLFICAFFALQSCSKIEESDDLDVVDNLQSVDIQLECDLLITGNTVNTKYKYLKTFKVSDEFIEYYEGIKMFLYSGYEDEAYVISSHYAFHNYTNNGPYLVCNNYVDYDIESPAPIATFTLSDASEKNSYITTEIKNYAGPNQYVEVSNIKNKVAGYYSYSTHYVQLNEINMMYVKANMQTNTIDIKEMVKVSGFIKIHQINE